MNKLFIASLVVLLAYAAADSLHSRSVSKRDASDDSGYVSPISKQTAVDRINSFNSSDFKYDLLGNLAPGGAGSVSLMTLANVPSLEFQGVSMALFNIEPCGLITPHLHPRATEILYNINGSNFLVYFVAESGANLVANNLTAGQAAFFPQGSIHFQQNLACETILVVAALNDEDPGLTPIGPVFFNFPLDVINAASGLNINAAPNAAQTPLLFSNDCKARCGL
jgi:oxalate decarboxylase/phosphoglucose isomerase-like protein (cupin superfamily)